MEKTHRVLIDLLSFQDSLWAENDQPSFLKIIHSEIQFLSSEELASLYVDAGYLRTFLIFLTEQHWLKTKQNLGIKLIFEEFVTPYLLEEISAMPALHEFLKASDVSTLKVFEEKALWIEQEILHLIMKRPYSEQKLFSKQGLTLISDIFEFENKLQIEKKQQGKYLAFCLYRTYDSLDEVFQLNYEADLGMNLVPNNTERLYEGSGVGVQSGYSTLMTALRYLNPSQGSRLIDLGSGYGRLGFVVGLLRPDTYVIGIFA